MVSNCDQTVHFQLERYETPSSARVLANIRQILIPDGSYRGRQAIIIEPEEQETQKLKPVYAKHSMFMDLPVELRLKVYKMLFEASNPVILRSERPPTFASTPSQFFSQKSLAIANVCRQIRFEVLPVIYGERTFCIDSPYVPDLVVENFLVNIGSSRKYLRFLDVGRYADSHWSRPDMFHRLLTCPNLQHVHFRVHAIGKTPEKYAEFFYKSARLWLNMRLQNNEKKRSGLEIVTFSNLPIGWHGGEWNENGGERLKIMIRELMDGDSS